MYSLLSIFAIVIPILEIALIILVMYTLIVLIKALHIYIRNNN